MWEGSALGEALASIPDINADGVSDIIAGGPAAAPSGKDFQGQVLLLSGKNGDLIRTFDGRTGGESFGYSVASCPDINSDGVSDILAAAESAEVEGKTCAGEVRAFSGKDGALLITLRGEAQREFLGRPVAGIPDIDGDGKGDILVGVPFARFKPRPGLHPPKGGPDAGDEDKGAGEVRVYSGGTGKLLYRIAPSPPQDWTSLTLAATGDIDRDGTPDFAIGSPYARQVHLCSGKDGKVFRVVAGENGAALFGEGLSTAGDIDADGFPDLLVGAPTNRGNNLPQDCALVVSGKDSSAILRVPSPFAMGKNPTWFGKAVAVLGDANADGVSDLLVGANCASTNGSLSGSIGLFSGKDATRLLTVSGAPMDRFGSTVVAPGDLNGDRVPDFVAGAPWALYGPKRAQGEVIAISGKDGAVLWRVSGRRW